MVLGVEDDLYVNITILESATSHGAEFHNWNRVKVKYCDGSSFTGDIEQVDPGSAKNLPSACISVMEPSLIKNILVPPHLDPQHVWKDCINNTSTCTSSQHIAIQAFGVESLKTFEGLPPCFTRGYFLTSCFSRGGILAPTFWLSSTSPRLLNNTIGEAVADWYFERARFQCIDPNSCVKVCKFLS
ncbi:hypothetical protein H5410_042764 [Solanum commersonii]|uniref:Pectin acetylesterase n=1 Tax=Solanum commersonii TaxID=4109 RepID=A0A9J5XWY1_SOLCO|nr:hypothetical protein H5410_042764 [Solanum commersonii]